VDGATEFKVGITIIYACRNPRSYCAFGDESIATIPGTDVMLLLNDVIQDRLRRSTCQRSREIRTPESLEIDRAQTSC
jgi:hypothetical protein